MKNILKGLKHMASQFFEEIKEQIEKIHIDNNVSPELTGQINDIINKAESQHQATIDKLEADISDLQQAMKLLAAQLVNAPLDADAKPAINETESDSAIQSINGNSVIGSVGTVIKNDNQEPEKNASADANDDPVEKTESSGEATANAQGA